MNRESPFDPFANESDSISIGDLDIENRVDQIEISGPITRDKRGLEAAEIILALMTAIILKLRKELAH